MSAAEAAQDLWDRIIGFVDDLDEDDWTRSTPCAEWDVHDLVGHISGVQVMFDAGATLPVPEGWQPPAGASPLDARTAAGVAARRGLDRGHLRTELQQARDGHVARLGRVADWSARTPGPLGETTEEGLLRVRMFDLWVHLQDLREAIGLEIDVTDTSQAAVLAHEHVISAVPFVFAKRAGAPEGARMALRLGPPVERDTVVAVTGGRARFEDGSDAGGSAVTGSPGALTMLCAGRHDAEHWRALGLLDWSGPHGEAFVQRGRFFPTG